MRVRVRLTLLFACVAYPAAWASLSANPVIPQTIAAPSDAVATLMQRVGAYVERYGVDASVIIAVEHYRQEVTELGTSSIRTETIMPGRPAMSTTSASGRSFKTVRRLTSEMALVRNTAAVGGWLGFRDVTEVDGKPTGETDRLRDIFAASAPDLAMARRITEENARYNVGPVTRTFNVPTSTLFFFHSANLSRFSFHRDGRERIDGTDTIKVAFKEVASPSLIMTGSGRDVPSSGTLWVNPTDGSVVRTHLLVSGYRGSNSTAAVDVSYHFDSSMKMLVPSTMREHYRVPSATVIAEATYADFKRFQTSVRIR